MSQPIQDMFEQIAPRYDCLNHVLSFQFDKRWRRQGVRPLVGCRHVLDLCAGTLDLSLELLRQSPETQITAVDFAREMLAFGRRKLNHRQEKQLSLHVADAQQLPFTAESFDGAMVAYGMRNVDDNERALQELHRVLAPGARFATLEFFRPESTMERLFDATYGRYILPWIGGLVSGHRAAYQYLRDSVRNYVSVSEYINSLKRCGFVDITATRQLGPSTLVVATRGVLQ